jgi:hypothetical protein
MDRVPPERDLAAIGLLQDPVRRALYEHVVAAGGEVSRNQAAEAVGVQRGLRPCVLARPRPRLVRGERLTPELGDARLRARKEERAAGTGDDRRRARVAWNAIAGA